MLDQAAPGGLIKYNPHSHVAQLLPPVKRAIFFTETTSPDELISGLSVRSQSRRISLNVRKYFNQNVVQHFARFGTGDVFLFLRNFPSISFLFLFLSLINLIIFTEIRILLLISFSWKITHVYIHNNFWNFSISRKFFRFLMKTKVSPFWRFLTNTI